mgnify:CR=1 FL=1
MNKVIFLGRLTAEPELRYTTGSNIPMCTFSIAVDRPFQKQGEERQADFFRIVAWRSTGEFASKYFRKGMRVLVEGSLRNNDYVDSQGVKRYGVDVQADRLYFADGKRDSGGQGYQPQQAEQTGFYPIGEDDEDPLPF